ncbi:MAG TPA: thioredoxin domain-containing protein, partial [Bacteroidales bacterium]|nr:thioredoxin domain-containing protein [Bacteroidales bacterium]
MNKIKDDAGNTNSLINETSPYLLQHAHNPVNWRPWSSKALDEARSSNKLVLVSIGYAACHWCHVMERESFEDRDIAAYMNKYFVCIKVDREERPDLDQIYLSAVQIMSGAGGWPLNCFTLPDGRPVFGGTYFKAEQWMDVLKALVKTYQQTPDKMTDYASQVEAGIAETELIRIKKPDMELSPAFIDNIVESWKKKFDENDGGLTGAPKFPMPVAWQFLLNYGVRQEGMPNPVLEHVIFTLEKLAKGGIYDQIGGGFARYSVDPHWQIPHFEKMLYDNAQLISLYASAYNAVKEPLFRQVVDETMEFIFRELTSAEGAFFSSLDADSEEGEGRYYTWREKQIREVLKDNTDEFLTYYGMAWLPGEDNQSVLFKRDIAGNEQKNDKSGKLTDLQIKSWKEMLFLKRSERPRPLTDDKILAGWNGLMISAAASAGIVFEDSGYINVALKAAEFILENMTTRDYRLSRKVSDSSLEYNAFLDDYAFVIAGFLKLYEATFNEEWIFRANELMKTAIRLFFDQPSGMFYYTDAGDKTLIARKMEITDNVISSSNSEMAKNLIILGKLLENQKYTNMARQMIMNVAGEIGTNGEFFANWLQGLEWFTYPQYEIIFTGPETKQFRKMAGQIALPGCLVAGAEDHSELPVFESRFLKGKSQI